MLVIKLVRSVNNGKCGNKKTQIGKSVYKEEKGLEGCFPAKR